MAYRRSPEISWYVAFIVRLPVPATRKDYLNAAVSICGNVTERFNAYLQNIIDCGMKFLIHSQTSTAQVLKFGNG